MKTRSATIAGFLAALVFLFASLPSLAQDTSDLGIFSLHFSVVVA